MGNIKQQRFWTVEEVHFLAVAYEDGMLVSDIAKALNRTKSSIIQKAMTLDDVEHKRYFTTKEREYIDKHIGRVSVYDMSKKLNRTYRSVKMYISKEYGLLRDNSNGLTCAEIGRVLNIDRNTVLKWCKNKGLKSRKVGRYRLVNETDLFLFLEEHPTLWDATKCEQYFFQSCDWFNKKRKEDFDKLVNKRWGGVYGKEKQNVS